MRGSFAWAEPWIHKKKQQKHKRLPIAQGPISLTLFMESLPLLSANKERKEGGVSPFFPLGLY